MMSKIKVMIIDDSAVVRQSLTQLLSSEQDIEVAATAGDPYIAASKLRKLVPDVIILDIEMPRMDGLTFLKKLMSQHPIPVVICSSLTQKNSKMGLDALDAGAVEVIEKPKVGVKEFFEESRILVSDAVRSASKIHPKRRKRAFVRPGKSSAGIGKSRSSGAGRGLTTTQKVVVVGASTGGTTALEVLLSGLPVDCPGIVIVQHMPERFTQTFAQRLNSLFPMDVKEAENGDGIHPGRVLIAPGNKHTLVKKSGTRYYVSVENGPLVSRHRPSVDMLFDSAATSSGKNTIAIILTGMGADGANGMEKLHNTGAYTIAQDERTSVVFGMPRECIQRGLVDKIFPLQDIAEQITTYQHKP
jgi:two-component system chemotaxis response regulator CheB